MICGNGGAQRSPGSSAGEASACNAGDPGLIPGSRRFPWRRDRLPTPVFLGFPGGSDGKESACKAGHLGSSPGGGNGNPLQYSCLENPTDRGAWWATVHGVAKSQTRLSFKHSILEPSQLHAHPTWSLHDLGQLTQL